MVDVYVRHGELRIDVEELFLQLTEEEQEEIIHKAAFEDIVEDIANVMICKDIRYGEVGKDRWIDIARKQILDHFGILQRSYIKTLLHRIDTQKASIDRLVRENKQLRELISNDHKIYQPMKWVHFPEDKRAEEVVAFQD